MNANIERSDLRSGAKTLQLQEHFLGLAQGDMQIAEGADARGDGRTHTLQGGRLVLQPLQPALSGEGLGKGQSNEDAVA
jgi:hypothetical protein